METNQQPKTKYRVQYLAWGDIMNIVWKSDYKNLTPFLHDHCVIPIETKTKVRYQFITKIN